MLFFHTTLSALSICSAMDVSSDDQFANTHLSLPKLIKYL